MLEKKNADYGDSALKPIRVFSKQGPEEQLLVRMDDKISRIKSRGAKHYKEDTVVDLLGYLVLYLKTKRPEESFSELIDFAVSVPASEPNVIFNVGGEPTTVQKIDYTLLLVKVSGLDEIRASRLISLLFDLIKKGA